MAICDRQVAVGIDLDVAVRQDQLYHHVPRHIQRIEHIEYVEFGGVMSQPRLRSRATTEQAAAAAVDQVCRSLRLPTIRARGAEITAAAEREQLTYSEFLAELLLAECDDRDRRRSARRITGAGLSREKWLDDFDFDANPQLPAATIHTLARCDWVRGASHSA